MAARNFSSTAVATTLSSSMTNVATTANVVANTGYPNAPFTIRVEPNTANEEIMLVTNKGTGLNWTVTRGYMGTTAVAHNSGVAVEHGVGALDFSEANVVANSQHFLVALSDEVSALFSSTPTLTMRAPFAFTLTGVRSSVNTASTSGPVTVDIKKNGASVLGANKLSIDVSEKTSVTAATPTSIVTSAFADDDEITFDVTLSGTGTKGLKVCLYYTVP